MSIHRTAQSVLLLTVSTALIATLCGCPGSGPDTEGAASDTVGAAAAAPSAAEPIAPPEEAVKPDEASEPAAAQPPGLMGADGAAAQGEAAPPPEPQPLVSIARPDAPPEFGPNPLRGGVPASQPLADVVPSANKPDGSRLKRLPFDPIKENGRFFVDWPKPKVALLISGRQDGYLEPCGCAGKERMKGGLMRRHELLNDLRNNRNWPVIGIDVGGLVKGFGLQAEMKFFTTVDAMRAMEYDAVALGASDLKLPADKLFSVVADTEAVPSPFVSANVGVFGFAHGMSAKYRVAQLGGVRVGITSVLGKGYQREINNPDVELSDPAAALAQIVPSLREECNVMVLLSHASMEESEELARKFPDFDVVVTAGGPPEPPDKPAVVEGTDTLLVEVGTQGMAAVVLGIYEESDLRIRYQRVIIDSRYADSAHVKQLLSNYQDQLRDRGLEGLGIRPAPHPDAETLGRFVGSAKCESCHEESYKTWKKSGHSDAWKILVNQDPPRNFDPECISCHVIGWHPTYYFPYQGGFMSEAETPELLNVGCETCHGPGEAHVRAEMGSDKGLQKKFQQAAVLSVEEAKERQCVTCHDLDNSPDFDFETYWPLVEHHED